MNVAFSFVIKTTGSQEILGLGDGRDDDGGNEDVADIVDEIYNEIKSNGVYLLFI